MKKSVVILLALLLLVGTAFASNQLISYQGRVGQNGQSLLTGNVTVYIYTASSGGSLVWSDTFTDSINKGYFDLVLGSNTPLSLTFGRHYFVDMDVNGQNINWSNGADRIEFESSVGSITTYVQNQSGWNKTGSYIYLFDTNDNVGIGTTTPLVKLHINSTDGIVIPVGTTLQRSINVTGMIRYNSETSQFEGYGMTSWGSLGGVIDVNQDTKITAEDSAGANNDELKFFTNGSERMRIYSNGNVGIGLSNPLAKLDVNDSIRLLGNTTLQGVLNLFLNKIINVSDPTNPQDVATKKYVDDNIISLNSSSISDLQTLNNSLNNRITSVQSNAAGWINTSSTTSTSLDVNVDSGTLFINSTSNNVGIGTINPGVVNGVAEAGVNLIIKNTVNSARLGIEGLGSGILDIVATGASANQKWFSIQSVGGNLITYSVNDAGNVVATAMAINATSGNVGIGTTSPNATLSVNGLIQLVPRTSATCNSSVEGAMFYNSSNKHFYGCNGAAWIKLDTTYED